MINIPTRDVDGVTYMATADVNDALGVVMSPLFIENTLKVPRDHHKKAGSYWLPKNLSAIRDALVNHLSGLEIMQ